MSKPLLGLILGGILGAFDGLSALVSSPNEPAVQQGIVGIVIGSTVKGLIVGIVTGAVARKYNSMGIGIGCGLASGFALALVVALLQGSHYLEIILPGSLVGVIVGFVTQKYCSPQRARSVLAPSTRHAADSRRPIVRMWIKTMIMTPGTCNRQSAKCWSICAVHRPELSHRLLVKALSRVAPENSIRRVSRSRSRDSEA
jgi:hypothetical protein